jgi:hypothetical protein
MAVYRNIVTGSIVSVADDYKLDANWEPFVDEVEVTPAAPEEPEDPAKDPAKDPAEETSKKATGK